MIESVQSRKIFLWEENIFQTFRSDIGTPGKLRHGADKIATLMARWRYPSLSLHGIQGAFADPGAKTVIPRKVVGKFSVRIVPNQTPEIVEKVVVDYCNKVWANRSSPNKMTASMFHGGRHGSIFCVMF